MSVYAVAPSIRPGGGTLPKWKDAGYKLAILRQGEAVKCADMQILVPKYRGWAASINYLCQWVMDADSNAEWFVVANDDTLPSERAVEEILCDLCDHYSPWLPARISERTFGVMQPIGDIFNWPSSRVDKFAGSPWLGREWCRRAYGGRGPLPDCYEHSWADEELQEVAIKHGVFWQRPDLTHAHLHWGRGAEDKPEWWDRIAHGSYQRDKPLFEARKRGGFAEGMQLLD